MKKIALTALVLTAVAGVAHAQDCKRTLTPISPLSGIDYTCNYKNPPAPSKSPGVSNFALTASKDVDGFLVWLGTETFDSTTGNKDGRKVTFAKPCPAQSAKWGEGTRWEFTINPSGPQCKSTDVYWDGYVIVFSNCTDGHSRICRAR